MSVISSLSNIVNQRTQQAENKIREGIAQTAARMREESLKVVRSVSARGFDAASFKVDLSAAGMKAAGRG